MTLPILLDPKYAKMDAVSYDEEEVVVIKDDRGTDVLDKDFNYICSGANTGEQ